MQNCFKKHAKLPKAGHQIQKPRTCQVQRNCTNTPPKTIEDHYRRNFMIPLVNHQWAEKSIWQWWPRNSSAVPICSSINATGTKRNMADVLWALMSRWLYGKESRNDKFPRLFRQLHQQLWRRLTIGCILTQQSASKYFFYHTSQHMRVKEMCLL